MKFIYFLYLIKITSFKKILQLILYAKKNQKKTGLSIAIDVLRKFKTYNTAFLDYFYLGFYKKTEHEIASYVNTLYMYRFQKKLNDQKKTVFFKDKELFYKKFHKYVCHEHFILAQNNVEQFSIWINDHQPKYIICKNSKGQSGKGIKKIKVSFEKKIFHMDGETIDIFHKKTINNNTDLIEAYIEQHPILMEFHKESVSTIRMITVIDSSNKVAILGSIIRFGFGDMVIDNFGAGGLAGKIDNDSGKILSPIIFKDPRNENIDIEKIKNHVIHTTIPFWEETKLLVHKAAMVVPEVKTVGWDIVITKKGPYLLEGNENWGNTIWQMTYGKGMKDTLDKYLN